MNAELPPFKNGEHNSESVSTLDRDITPLAIKSKRYLPFELRLKYPLVFQLILISNKLTFQ